VNDGEGFHFFYLKYGNEKQKSYRHLVSAHPWWFDFYGLREAKMRERMIPRERKIKAHCERMKPRFLLNGFTCELIDPKQIIC